MSRVRPHSGVNQSSSTIGVKPNLCAKPKQVDLSSAPSSQFQPIKTAKKAFGFTPTTAIPTDLKPILNVLTSKSIAMPPQQLHSATEIEFRQQKTIKNWYKKPAAEQVDAQPLSYIDASSLNIKPAYRSQSVEMKAPKINNFVGEKDNYSIMAVMLKKGVKIDVSHIAPTVNGQAQNKLRLLLKQKTNTNENALTKKKIDFAMSQEINEVIEIQDEYDKQSFQKASIAFQSGIRESIVGDSKDIKESIRQSIRQSIKGSYDSSKIKSSIKESIKQSIKESKSIREEIKEEFQNSYNSLKQEIIQEISASHKKSVEEIYQDIFQEESISNSLNKSYKKQNLRESDSASKSFRMKTGLNKSIKMAEDIIKGKIPNKLSPEINNQRLNLELLKASVQKILKPKIINFDSKNKDLLYRFRIQINKLLSRKDFDSKLEKLTAFLKTGHEINRSSKDIANLQDKILSNLLMQIERLKNNANGNADIQKIKGEYQQKLKDELKKQEINLKTHFLDELTKKDRQLKLMIAELQQKFLNQPRSNYSKGLQIHDLIPGQSHISQVESDFSIDSDNISWKADLWQLLPEAQKRKLYQKQSNQVTNFLTSILMQQLKGESLDRSLDISFDFPEGSNEVAQRNESNVKLRQSFLADLPDLPLLKNSEQSFKKQEQSNEVAEQITHKNHTIKASILKTLSQYKQAYIKRKDEVLSKLMNILASKNQPQHSAIQGMQILSEREIKANDLIYVRAYEEHLIWALIGIYNKNKIDKQAEREMRQMYERLLVVSQISTAQDCVQTVKIQAYSTMKLASFCTNNLQQKIAIMHRNPCPLESGPNELYIALKTKEEEIALQNQLVNSIAEMLTAQFAKEFPKRKK